MTHHQPTEGEGYLDRVADDSPSKFEWRPDDVVLHLPENEDDEDESTGLGATS